MKEPENNQEIDLSDTFANFKPNRKMRRARLPVDKNAVKVPRRYDKVLGKFYGIPKAFRQHAKRHGVSMELLCSNLLQAGAIQYKELPKDLNDRIFWRKA
jgi:hypothetical protein